VGDEFGVVGLSRLDQPNHLYWQITRDQGRIAVRIVLRYQQSWLWPSKYRDRDEICRSKLVVDGISPQSVVSKTRLCCELNLPGVVCGMPSWQSGQ